MTTLLVTFKNLEKLHPDLSSCIDEGLTRSCAGNRGSSALRYKGNIKGQDVYEFGETTTVAQVEAEMKKLNKEFRPAIATYSIVEE